ncbi:MAG: hypothetical protein HQK51_21050, partial [Oligoflexia bacterium]|nr:hypothetical protein [Oligoflexia bacterium]
MKKNNITLFYFFTFVTNLIIVNVSVMASSSKTIGISTYSSGVNVDCDTSVSEDTSMKRAANLKAGVDTVYTNYKKKKENYLQKLKELEEKFDFINKKSNWKGYSKQEEKKAVLSSYMEDIAALKKSYE